VGYRHALRERICTTRRLLYSKKIVTSAALVEVCDLLSAILVIFCRLDNCTAWIQGVTAAAANDISRQLFLLLAVTSKKNKIKYNIHLLKADRMHTASTQCKAIKCIRYYIETT